jgi:inorganic pyrophosphatase
VFLVLIWLKKDINSGEYVPGFVECIKGDTIKFEFNAKLNKILPDSVNGLPRVLTIPYPYAYGFIPVIKSLDGDFLDSFFIGSSSINYGDQLNFEPKLAIFMTDNGVEDTKLICVEQDFELDNKSITEIVFFLKNYSKDRIKIDSIIEIKNFKKFSKKLNKYQNNLEIK